METLNRILRTATRHLASLSVTARLLIASIGIILAMCMFLVSLYSGRTRLVPIHARMTEEETARVVGHLERYDIVHEFNGGVLRVPEEQRLSIMSDLIDQQLLAGDDIDYGAMLETGDPMMDRQARSQQYLVAKMAMTSELVAGLAPIHGAKVLLDKPERGFGLGQPNHKHTASVTVTPVDGSLGQSLVDSIARIVAGAQSGLDPADVQVINATTGTAHQPRSGDEVLSGGYLEIQEQTAERFKDVLLDVVGYIPGVRVSVNAQVETMSLERTRQGFEEPKVGPVEERTRTYAARNAAAGSEPGVMANAGRSLGPSRDGSTVADERTDARTVPVFGSEQAHERREAGFPLKIDASIAVPESYLVWKYQQTVGDPQAVPTAADLEPIEADVVATVTAQTRPLVRTDALGTTVPGSVTVSTYPDGAAAAVLGLDEISSAGVGGLALGGEGTSSIVRLVSLGGLAVASILMMLMMVRRATRHESLPTAEDLVGIPPALSDEETDLIGEADEATMTMEGLELDDDEVEGQQMLQQVNQLALESPGEAATLLRKWLRTDM